MRYVVDLEGERYDVAIDGPSVSIGSESLTAHLEEIEGTPIKLVTIGDEVHRVIARRGAGRGSYTLWVGGHRFSVEALDERTRAIRDISAASAVASGPAPLIAPMPGLIVRVNVAPGDAVKPGQGLVVIEAMKMENELRAAAAGTVRAVSVAAGQAVEKGALLVELDA
jgi:pyruvate carboxylase subunit B